MDNENEKFIAAHDELKKFGAEIISRANDSVAEHKESRKRRLIEFEKKPNEKVKIVIDKDAEAEEREPRGLRVFCDLFQDALHELLKNNSNKIVGIYDLVFRTMYAGIPDQSSEEHDVSEEASSTFGWFTGEDIEKFRGILKSFNLLPTDMETSHSTIKKISDEWVAKENKAFEDALKEDGELGLLDDGPNKKNTN